MFVIHNYTYMHFMAYIDHNSRRYSFSFEIYIGRVCSTKKDVRNCTGTVLILFEHKLGRP